MFRKVLVVSVSLALTLCLGVASQGAMFDIEGASGNTQSGWTSVTVGVPATDDGITVLVGDFAAADWRDRLVANTAQGADNNDNPVPEGTFSDIYRDFYFKRDAVPVNVSFSGLDPNTIYNVTAWSYDSGAFNSAGNAVIQDFTAGGPVLANLTYSGDLASGPGPDPNTNSLDDYSVTFQITSDAAGLAAFATSSSGGQGARLNAIHISAVPEPGTLAIASLALVGLGLAVRRK